MNIVTQGRPAELLVINTALATGLLFMGQFRPEVFALFALLLAGTRFRESCRAGWPMLRPLFLLLLVATIASTALSLQPWRSVQGTRDLLLGLLFFLPFSACGQLLQEPRLRLLFGWILVAASFALVLGYAACMAYADVLDPLDMPYLYDWWRNQNYIGSQLGMNIVLLAALVRYGEPGARLRNAAVLACVAMLVLLLGLHVRGAILALALALPVAWLSASSRWRLRIPLAAALGTIALLFVAHMYPAQIYAALPQAFHDPGDLSNGRLAFMENVLQATAQRPWFGWGPNTFKLTEYAVIQRAWGPEPHTYPHSVYLELLFSFGLLGTLMIFAGALWAYRNLRGERTAITSALGGGLLVFLLARGAFEIQLVELEFSSGIGIALGLLAGGLLYRRQDNAAAGSNAGKLDQRG